MTTSADKKPTQPDVAAIEARFAGVEAKRAALVEELDRLASEIPDVPPWSMLKAQATTEARSALKIGEVARWRAMIAEIQRPKGPMVFVHYPGTGRSVGHELAEVTSKAIVLHSGDRFSRATGLRIGRTSLAAEPYIAGEEIDRVLALALKWKPAKGAK